MRFQVGIQIVLLILAGVIAFSVIKPKFADIREDQNEVVAYKAALDNLGKYNQRLQALINQSNAVPSADREALFRYLPESIDTTAVSRDITNIVSRNSLLLLEISFEPIAPITTVNPDGSVVAASLGNPADVSGGVVEGSAGPALVSQKFKVNVVGTYNQMKSMMSDLERNDYPLRVVEFNFSLEETETNLVQYSLVLETYALPATSQES